MRAEDILYNSKKAMPTTQSKADQVNALAQNFISVATQNKTASKKDNGVSTASESKNAKAKTEQPVEIQALGAGDYGASKETRVDKVLKGAIQSTNASLINTAGTLVGHNDGGLTMGQSAIAAAKGEDYTTATEKKKDRQDKFSDALKQNLYNKADELTEKSNENIASAKEGLGKVGQTLVDVGVAGTQMLGDAALNIAVPGAGLVGMGLRSFGSGAQEQRQKGGTETDMLLGGLKSAAIEVLTEKIGGPFEKVYGKSFLGKTVNGAIDKLSKSGAMASVLKLFANGASEAAEEVISDILNPLADRLLDLDNKRGSGEKIGVFSEENVENMIHDGLVGGILGMVGTGTQVIGNTIAKSNANVQTAQNAPQEVVGEDSQTTQDVVQNPVTEPQSALNSALQNDNAQTQTNPVVEAIQNTQQNNPISQLNIDNAAIPVYNNSQNGGANNELYGTSGEGLPGRDGNNTSIEGSGADRRRDIQLSQPTALSENSRQRITQRGIEPIDIPVTMDNAAFSVALSNSKYANADTVVEKQGAYPIYTKAELDALPTFGKDGYEDAMNYRDRLPTNTVDDGLGAANLGSLDVPNPIGEWQSAAIEQGEDAVHPISDEQIQNRLEQQNAVPVDVPKLDINGNLTSKSVSTLANSGVTPEKMAEAIMYDARNGSFSHIEYSDDSALSNANAKIEAVGWEQALGEYRTAVEDGKVSKDITALGITLYNNAVTAGDYMTAIDIVSLMTKNSTTMAQGLQAMRILNKLSPDSRLYMAVKSVENIAREIKAKYNLDTDIEIDSELLTEYRAALESGDKAKAKEAWGNIEQNIADQIPNSWKDKLNAWRYLSMLGNPRTHIRNIVGNAFFAPVVLTKNLLATGIESTVNALGGNIERTKAIINPTAEADRALLATAWADFANSREAIMSGGKFNDKTSGINDKRTIFNFKPLEKVRQTNSTLLDVEDAWFSQPQYAYALASYLKANGISAVEYSNGSLSAEQISKAQAYAIKEAQKATYRDTNKFSSLISGLGKTDSKVVNMIVEGTLPFKKTPANILARAVEYSPAGIAIEAAKVAMGETTAAEFIDGLSAGLTGTAILAFGAWLASQGLLSGGKDKDDEQDSFNKLQGYQDYAVNLFGKSYTLDWLAPEALPLFVGVEMYNNLQGDKSIWDLIQALVNISDPMLDMSMLQGVSDMFDNISYADNKMLAVAANASFSYLSQFVPTLFGQIERAFTEDTRQSTFIDRTSETPTDVQYAMGKLFNKAPGEYQQMDYIDAWGRTQSTGNAAQRTVNNFFNPAYVSDKRTTEVENNLQSLYDAGYTNVFPERAGTSTKVNGEYLSKEDYIKYAKTQGEQSLALVEKFMRSSEYKQMSDADKAATISELYTYAKDEAKLAVDKNTDVPTWHEEAKASGNPAAYIADRADYKSKSEGGGDSLAAKATAIRNGYSEQKIYDSWVNDEGKPVEQRDKYDAMNAKLSANNQVPLATYLDIYSYKTSLTTPEDTNDKNYCKKEFRKYLQTMVDSKEISAEQGNAIFLSFYKDWKNSK